MDAQVIYVDDSGLVGVGTDLVGDGRRPPLLEAADIIADVLGLYGLFFKPTKRQGPASQLVFIGVGADIGSPPHLYLTDERRRKIRDELHGVAASRSRRTHSDPCRGEEVCWIIVLGFHRIYCGTHVCSTDVGRVGGGAGGASTSWFQVSVGAPDRILGGRGLVD